VHSSLRDTDRDIRMSPRQPFANAASTGDTAASRDGTVESLSEESLQTAGASIPMQLEHVNMTVKDLEESVHFYCELLDGEVSWRGKALNMKGVVPAAHVRLGSGYLSMFEREHGERAPYDYGPPGINHIGFVIDDLGATRSRLAALGTPIEKEADYEPGMRLYVFDPNGIEIELVSYGAPEAPA